MASARCGIGAALRRNALGAVVATIAVLELVRAAHACAADADCEMSPPALVTELKGGKACYGLFGQGVPFLNPYNDTRANLALLLADRKILTLAVPRPPDATTPPPEPGTLAVPPTFAVPFRMEDLRRPPPEKSDPPSPPAEQADLMPLAAQLGLAEDAISDAMTRVGAAQTGRCAAETPATVLGFVEAVAATPGLDGAERTALAQERLRIAGLCLNITEPAPPLAVASREGQAFATYLEGARHFYRDELPAAEASFTALTQSQAAWVKETALYMVGRVHLNEAQFDAFKDYGQLDAASIDRAKLTQAKDDLRAYLQAYPTGRYAASARGLFRRIDWLAGSGSALSRDFADAFDAFAKEPPGADAVYALLDEIDSKYLTGSTAPARPDDPSDPNHWSPWAVPELAATDVLRAMRDATDAAGKSTGKSVPREEIVKHKAELAAGALPRLPDLLDLADAYWVEHDPAKVIAATADLRPNSGLDNIAFSLIVLRGIALESQGKNADADALWHRLLAASTDPLRNDLLQLAIALNEERSGHVAAVFAADSPVKDLALHRALLKYAAPPDLLRTVAGRADAPAEDRSTALFTLLYKELAHGDAKGFGATFAQFPPQNFAEIDGLKNFLWSGQSAPDYACPALAATTKTLASAPDDPKALNCLAEFFYRFEDHLTAGTKPPADELGGTPDGFAGAARSRLDLYLAVIANPKAKGDAEAYALYRAVNCFASSGNNHCGDQDIPKDQRKRWFERLKTVYKDNGWGRQQKYWW